MFSLKVANIIHNHVHYYTVLAGAGMAVINVALLASAMLIALWMKK